MDLRVDGLIFDHAADAKDENSTSENLFICKFSYENSVIVIDSIEFQLRSAKN